MNVARFVCTENMAQTILPDHSGHPQTVLNYEAVKYFSGEEYEGERYRDSIKNYRALDRQVICGGHPLYLR